MRVEDDARGPDRTRVLFNGSLRIYHMHTQSGSDKQRTKSPQLLEPIEYRKLMSWEASKEIWGQSLQEATDRSLHR